MPRQVQTGFCLFAAALFLVACEPPTMRDANPVVNTTESAQPEKSTVVAPVVAVAEEPVRVEPQKEAPEGPELDVAMVGSTITISGGLTSRIQVERIVETLTREFPNHKIENHLNLEYHRTPVGWGNRVADELLVPYFSMVKSPRVAYSNGTVTLEGTVGSMGVHKMVTELAINAFSGDYTENVANRIKVEE